MLKGIDISQWQGTTPPLEGLAFVGIRASIGATKDTKYDQHYANVRKAGPIVIAYHYGVDAAVVPIAKQADVFLAASANADLLALDQEASGFDDAEAQEFVDLVKAARPAVGLYHSSSGFAGVRVDWQWVADWRDSSEAEGYPNKADGSGEFPGWDIWQYDGGGADNLDNDLWNPATTVASLLRMGYITKAQADAAVKAAVDPLKAEVANLTEDKAALAAQLNDAQVMLGKALEKIDADQVALDKAAADLAAAPGIEREAIALAMGRAEADRVRNAQ